MDRFLGQYAQAPGTRGWIALSAVLLTVFAGTTQGQSPPPQPENPSWPAQDNKLRQEQAGGQDANAPISWEEGCRRHAAQQLAQKREENRAELRTLLRVWLPLTLAAVGGLALLWLLGRLYLHYGVTTDPARLAQSDPWLRARLAQVNARSPGLAGPGPAQDIAADPPPAEGWPPLAAAATEAADSPERKRGKTAL
jgi:hypothetical protein